MRQQITNKLNNLIQYDSNAKGYRYYVDGNPKSSVTTVIGKYKDTGAFSFRKRDKCLIALKNKLLSQKKPLDEVNALIEDIKREGQRLEEVDMNIGSNMHEFVELYLKDKKPALSNEQPLQRMQQMFMEWWPKQKFIVKAIELPLYSPKYDRAGCLDILVTKKAWNGKLALMDFKTSKDFYSDQPTQLVTYKSFLEESTDYKISKLAIVNIPKDPNKKISMWALNMKDEKKYFKAFRCAMYLEKLDKFFNKQKKEYKKKEGRNV